MKREWWIIWGNETCDEVLDYEVRDGDVTHVIDAASYQKAVDGLKEIAFRDHTSEDFEDMMKGSYFLEPSECKSMDCYLILKDLGELNET